MKIARVLRRRLITPGGIGSTVALLGIAVLHPTPAGVAGAFTGLVLGVLSGTMLLQLALLVAAVACGVRVHRIVLGMGPRLAERSTARRTIVLRAVPIMLGVAIGPGRAPVRKRMFAAGLVTAALSILAGGCFCWWALPSGNAVGVGAAAAVAGSLLLSLRPRRGMTSTSTGWLIFDVPRLTGLRAQELDAAPLVNEVMDAVNAGDVTAADAIADALAAEYPDLRAAVFARVSVLEARGQYATALPLVLGLLSDPADAPVPADAPNGGGRWAAHGAEHGAEHDQRDAALLLAGLAGLASAAVEAGQLDADLGLPIAQRAVADVASLGYPAHKLDGTRAVLELLTGSPRRAAELAAAAAATGDHLLTRADDLATLARARMAMGDNRSARSALAEAERIAAWWPRVAATRATLNLATG